jgi:flagellar basal body-associated protein FliL
MAEEEAQKQEQNAEATEAVEAGAEAVEEVAVAEVKAPSMLMPMLLSAVITVVGVGVMVMVILPMQIEKAIAGVTAHHGDANGSAHGAGEGHGAADGEHGAADGEHGAADGEHGEPAAEGEEDTAATEEDDPKKPEPIVPEGESIVINPANSNGTRYLLVEIYLLRDNEKDTAFPKEVAKHTKMLQALTVDYLSAEDTQSLANPVTKDRLKAQLKLAYQDKLGVGHPIKELIVSKWIMQ